MHACTFAIRLRVARRVSAALAAVLRCACAVHAADAPKPTHVVQDPHYGDTLFHFFQDHYFTAVTA